MNHIPDEACDAFPVTEILEMLGKRTRPSGRGSISLCPFHADSRPSFSVLKATNFFHCFACHARGRGAIKFMEMLQGISREEAIRILRTEYLPGGTLDGTAYTGEAKKSFQPEQPVWPTEEERQLYKVFYDALSPVEEGDTAYHYLTEGRGFSAEAIQKAGVKWVRTVGKLQDILFRDGKTRDISFRRGLAKLKKPDLLVFPFFKDKEIVYFQGRAIPPMSYRTKYINLAGGVPALYNIDSVGNASHVFLTEGLPDCLSFVSCGYTAVGMVSTTFKTEWLKDLKGKSVVITIDDDGKFQKHGGKNAVKMPVYVEKCRTLLSKFRQEPSIRISVCHLPINTDVNEFLQKYPEFPFKKIDGSRPYYRV
jgi:DNA primase